MYKVQINLHKYNLSLPVLSNDKNITNFPEITWLFFMCEGDFKCSAIWEMAIFHVQKQAF